MKRLFMLTLAIVCLGIAQEAYAKIINGYDHDLIRAQQRLSNLNEIAQGALSKDQRKRLKKYLKAIRTTADELQENRAKTQEIIDMLSVIDPGLYNEMSTIRDREGHETNVYIKVVDALGPGVLGVTNLDQSVENPNVYNSEYGDYTVSIRINHVRSLKNLGVLVHELGHVRYQVPHLANYKAFYKRVYQDQYFKGVEIGHRDDDPSHQSVKETMKTFLEAWREYKEEGENRIQDDSTTPWPPIRENE